MNLENHSSIKAEINVANEIEVVEKCSCCEYERFIYLTKQDLQNMLALVEEKEQKEQKVKPTVRKSLHELASDEKNMF